jgi:hypothetical protein
MQALFALQQAATAATAAAAPTDVGGAVTLLTNFLLKYITPLAAVGALSMALIELGKKLLDSRTKFQTLRWITWMQQTGGQGANHQPNGVAPVIAAQRSGEIERALTQLLQLCTGVSIVEAEDAARALIASGGKLPLLYAWSRSPAHSVFALDLSRMMGSIQEAADIALASPGPYESLFRFMTLGSDPTDVTNWLKKGPAAALNVDGLPDADQKRVIREQAERFARLRQIVKRKLDGFQLYTGDRWGTWNQFAANIVGFIVMFSSLLYLNWVARNVSLNAPELLSSFTPTIIPISLLGGILSPVAKDLVNALKSVTDG